MDDHDWALKQPWWRLGIPKFKIRIVPSLMKIESLQTSNRLKLLMKTVPPHGRDHNKAVYRLLNHQRWRGWTPWSFRMAKASSTMANLRYPAKNNEFLGLQKTKGLVSTQSIDPEKNHLGWWEFGCKSLAFTQRLPPMVPLKMLGPPWSWK